MEVHNIPRELFDQFANSQSFKASVLENGVHLGKTARGSFVFWRELNVVLAPGEAFQFGMIDGSTVITNIVWAEYAPHVSVYAGMTSSVKDEPVELEWRDSVMININRPICCFGQDGLIEDMFEVFKAVKAICDGMAEPEPLAAPEW